MKIGRFEKRILKVLDDKAMVQDRENAQPLDPVKDLAHSFDLHPAVSRNRPEVKGEHADE